MPAMLVFADLHLREENADLIFQEVLPWVRREAQNRACHTVACLGDFWQVRHRLPVRLLNAVLDLLAEWTRQGLKVILLAGNHDQVDVSGRNALEVLAGVPGVAVYSYPTTDEWGCWVPYRKDVSELVGVLRELPAGLPLYGHFGVQSAWMTGAFRDSDGVPLDELAKFRYSMLGHYHRPQRLVAQLSELFYSGSLYQVTAGEAGEEKQAVVCYAADENLRPFPVPARLGPRYFNLTEEPTAELLVRLGVTQRDIVRVTVPAGGSLERAARVLADAGVTQHTVAQAVEVSGERLEVYPSADGEVDLVAYFRALVESRNKALPPGAPPWDVERLTSMLAALRAPSGTGVAL